MCKHWGFSCKVESWVFLAFGCKLLFFAFLSKWVHFKLSFGIEVGNMAETYCVTTTSIKSLQSSAFEWNVLDFNIIGPFDNEDDAKTTKRHVKALFASFAHRRFGECENNKVIRHLIVSGKTRKLCTHPSEMITFDTFSRLFQPKGWTKTPINLFHFTNPNVLFVQMCIKHFQRL